MYIHTRLYNIYIYIYIYIESVKDNNQFRIRSLTLIYIYIYMYIHSMLYKNHGLKYERIYIRYMQDLRHGGYTGCT